MSAWTLTFELSIYKSNSRFVHTVHSYIEQPFACCSPRAVRLSSIVPGELLGDPADAERLVRARRHRVRAQARGIRAAGTVHTRT